MTTPPGSDQPQTLAVYDAPDAVTANLLIGVLATEGIPAALGEQVTGAYVGPFTIAEGYFGEVRVPREDVERARDVVQQFVERLAAKPPISDDELAAQAEASYDPNV